MPANTTSTVACPAGAAAPTPPTVNDNCGRSLSVSAPVVTGNVTCSGDIVYTFTYTDCANATYTWTHTTTVSPPIVTMPANTTSTVACPAGAAAPTPPTVNDNCGRPLSVSAPVVTGNVTCSGDIVYTFTYTDCANATYTWTHTTTVSPPIVTMPANTTSTVACPAGASAPTPPTVNDNCGRPLSVSAPVVTGNVTCSGDIVYTFTYTDCANATYTWTHTTTVSPPIVVMPANTTSTVACPADATAPTPPVVNDNCGTPLSVSAPVVTGNVTCSCDIVYTFTYTDCANATYTWTHTTTVSPPIVTMPANTTSTVACPAGAAAPTPPTVNDNCGRPLSVSAPVVTGNVTCSGDIVYTFTYTDCANATYTWTHTTTVSPPIVTMPANTTSTVACPAAASAPTPPTVNDNCGRPLSVSAPVVTGNVTCSGDIVYTFTYTDCANATYTWTHTTTVSPPIVTMPANTTSTVACPAAASAPTPPTVNDNCGRPLSVSAPVVTGNVTCSGDIVYTFTYTDCANATYTWTHTTTVSPPIVTMPANTT